MQIKRNRVTAEELEEMLESQATPSNTHDSVDDSKFANEFHEVAQPDIVVDILKAIPRGCQS